MKKSLFQIIKDSNFECKPSYKLAAGITAGLVLGNIIWWNLEPYLSQKFPEEVLVYSNYDIITQGPYYPGKDIVITYTAEKHQQCQTTTIPFWISDKNEVVHRGHPIVGDHLEMGFQTVRKTVTIPGTSLLPQDTLSVGYKELKTFICGDIKRAFTINTPVIWVELTLNPDIGGRETGKDTSMVAFGFGS